MRKKTPDKVGIIEHALQNPYLGRMSRVGHFEVVISVQSLRARKVLLAGEQRFLTGFSRE